MPGPPPSWFKWRAKRQEKYPLRVESERIDAKQLIDILTLAAGQGDSVRVIAEVQADRAVFNQIIALFADGFGE